MGAAVKRSITFPVDPRWIKNPTNSPLATPAARMGAAAQTKLCIATIGFILDEHFRRKPGRSFVDVVPNEQGGLTANKWIVRLTRISMGTLDPLTGGASMKAVQDAVARWCGVPNERDPVWHWVEPIGQEKRGFVQTPDGRRAWTGVRIEVEDLEPGASRPPVVLATIDRFVALAKAEIKREAAEKQAKGGPPKPAKTKGWSKADVDAVARELRGCGVRYKRAGGELVPRGKLGPGGDEEKSPRQLKPCPRVSCFAALDVPCKLLPGDLVVHGVHAERAQAAGVEGIALPHPRPSEATGKRTLVPSGPRPVPVWLALPWLQKACVECSGKGYFGVVGHPWCGACKRTGVVGPEHLTLESRVDGRNPPRCLRYNVPPEHVARWGREVVLWPRGREDVRGVEGVVFAIGKRG